MYHNLKNETIKFPSISRDSLDK